MKGFLLRQFNYDLKANRDVLAAIKETKDISPRAMFLFSHLLNVHRMWYCRFSNVQLNTGLYDERHPDECAVIMEENYKNWINLINTMNQNDWEAELDFIYPLDRTIRLIRKGDAIGHVLTHSAYHRGQIVSLMKGLREDLPVTTAIVYASEIKEE